MAALIVFCGVVFFFSSDILALIQIHLQQKLAYFDITEPFISLVKLSLVISLFLLVPVIAVAVWRALSGPFGLSAISGFAFVTLSIVLFYSGAAFCYFFTLPFGIKFLLGYQTAHVKAVISLDQFLTFCFAFLVSFGAMFELPLIMVFCAKIGICKGDFFRRYRRYAIFVVSIVSAAVTPTPDIFNMMLMMAPLYALYELGIAAIWLLGM